VLSFLAVLSGCGHPDYMGSLREIECYLDENPDSALVALKSMEKSIYDGGKELKAKHALLLATAIDKVGIDTCDTKIVQPAVNYYRRRGTPSERLRSMYYLGRMQQNADDYNAATITFMAAANLLDEAKDDRYAAMLYSAMSFVEASSYDALEALHYSTMAYDAVKKLDDPGLESFAAFSLAQDYENLGRWREADSLFSALEVRLAGQHASSLLPDVEKKHAYMLMLKSEPEYAKAVTLFQSAIEVSGGLDEENLIGAYGVALAGIGKHEEATTVMGLLTKGTYEYHLWNGELQHLLGQDAEAYENLSLADSINAEAVALAMANSLAKTQRDYFKSMESESRRQAENLRLWIATIVLVVVIFLIIGFIAIRNEMSRSEDEKARLMQFADGVSAELEDVKNRWDSERKIVVDKFIEQYRMQFGFFNEIGEAVLVADENGRASSRKVFQKAKDMIRKIHSDANGQRRFEAAIDEHMNGIMKRLREEIPSLSEEEVRMASYFFAGFNANMISLLLDYPSIPAVYARKSRLRKKIEMSDAKDKRLFLGVMC